jgi:hypothetical protein
VWRQLEHRERLKGDMRPVKPLAPAGWILHCMKKKKKKKKKTGPSTRRHGS